MSELISTRELCSRFKVTRKTVQTWISLGLPFARIRGKRSGGEKQKAVGRPSNRFNLEEVKAWLISRNEGAGLVARTITTQSRDVEQPATPGEEEESDVVTMLERMKIAEMVTHEAWSTRVKTGGVSVAELNVLQKSWQNTVMYRAKLEKEAPRVLAARAKYRPIAEIRANMGRIGTILKQHILSVGATARDEITPFLRDPEAASTVVEIIDARCRAALDTCCESMEKLTKEKTTSG